MAWFDWWRGGQARRERNPARVAFSRQVRAAFDGATKSRRSAGWRAVGTSADAEIGKAGVVLRNVARDMVRNVPIAARAQQMIANNVVGTGIVPAIRGRDGFVKRVDPLLIEHLDTPNIDANGRTDLYGIEAGIVAAVAVDGEVLVRRRWRRPEDRLPLPFQLQVLEIDHLDTSIDGPIGTGFAVQGIEFDLLGRRVAYHLFDEHPGAWSRYTLPQSRRIPASEVAHVYRQDRAGQMRGASWFAPVIMRMRDQADASDAHLMRFKIAACYAAFVKGGDEEQDPDDLEDVDGDDRLTALGPGIVEYLRQGEEVTFGTPPQVGDYGPYMRAIGQEIAAGLGLTYEGLYGNYADVNFSSGRMGWLEFQRNVAAWQNHMMIPSLCRPVQRWTMEAVAVRLGSSEGLDWSWTPPRREMISPVDEIPAIRDAIRSGLSSRSTEVRKLGYDPEAIDAENAADNARADSMKLAFDSDGRRSLKAGAAQQTGNENAQKPAH